MNNTLDTKRILIFLAFAFGIAWAVSLAIYLTGGLVASPQLITGMNLALILMAGPYMWAPALANIFTRRFTREGWKNTGLRPNFKRGWRYYIIAWFLPAILVVLGATLYFLLFPQHFDPTLGAVRAMLEGVGQAGVIDPWTVVLIQTGVAILAAPLINTLFAFGEEFGWRAYLLPKLMVLGARKAMIISGIIWGVWHWPVIFMGYEYGFEYPGSPWLGPLAFLIFTTTGGIFLSWLALRSGSVWPAAIGHGALNGIAGVPVYFIGGTPNPLVGPLAVGVLGGLPIIVLAVYLFFHSRALAPADSGDLPLTGQVEPAAA